MPVLSHISYFLTKLHVGTAPQIMLVWYLYKLPMANINIIGKMLNLPSYVLINFAVKLKLTFPVK